MSNPESVKFATWSDAAAGKVSPEDVLSGRVKIVSEEAAVEAAADAAEAASLARMLSAALDAEDPASEIRGLQARGFRIVLDGKGNYRLAKVKAGSVKP